MFASSTNSGPAEFGYVGAYIFRDGFLHANEAGNLTASIQYSVTRSGLPTPIGNLASGVYTVLELGNLSVQGQFGSPYDVGSKSGTLSLTRFFDAGESASFGLRTITQQHRGVPVPDMLWPTLVGMMGIVFWAERRRRQDGLAR